MIRLLSPSDSDSYRKVRLLALKTDPISFLSTYNDEKNKNIDWFRQKITLSAKLPHYGYYGYFEKDNLIALAQITDGYYSKKAHINYLNEVYVVPEYRRKGIAKKLIRCLIELVKSQSKTEQLQLRVNSGNIAAVSLYKELGFKKIATLPESVKEPDGSYQDEYIFSLNLT